MSLKCRPDGTAPVGRPILAVETFRSKEIEMLDNRDGDEPVYEARLVSFFFPSDSPAWIFRPRDAPLKAAQTAERMRNDKSSPLVARRLGPSKSAEGDG